MVGSMLAAFELLVTIKAQYPIFVTYYNICPFIGGTTVSLPPCIDNFLTYKENDKKHLHTCEVC